MSKEQIIEQFAEWICWVRKPNPTVDDCHCGKMAQDMDCNLCYAKYILEQLPSLVILQGDDKGLLTEKDIPDKWFAGFREEISLLEVFRIAKEEGLFHQQKALDAKKHKDKEDLMLSMLADKDVAITDLKTLLEMSQNCIVEDNDKHKAEIETLTKELDALNKTLGSL